MKKILIFYTAHTIGHKAIAQNIGYWFESLGWQVEMRDALQTAGNNDASLKWFLKIHSLINIYTPFIWKWLYNWGYVFTKPFFGLAAKKYTAQFLQIIKEVNPNLILTTQISPSSVMSVIKKSDAWQGKWITAFSDYHFHPAWSYKNSDGFLINTEEQKNILIRKGFDPKMIAVSGLWTKPRPEINTGEIKNKLGIPQSSKVLLLGAGSTAWVDFSIITSSIRQVVELGKKDSINISVVVVCGKNITQQEVMKKEAAGQEWTILGWYENMHELYAISDAFITKPGGLSIAESMQWQLPCFIPFMLPGQEELNISYLKKRNLIHLLLDDPKNTWAKNIYKELVSHDFKKQLGQNKETEKITGYASKEKLQAFLNQLFLG